MENVALPTSDGTVGYTQVAIIPHHESAAGHAEIRQPFSEGRPRDRAEVSVNERFLPPIGRPDISASQGDGRSIAAHHQLSRGSPSQRVDRALIIGRNEQAFGSDRQMEKGLRIAQAQDLINSRLLRVGYGRSIRC